MAIIVVGFVVSKREKKRKGKMQKAVSDQKGGRVLGLGVLLLSE